MASAAIHVERLAGRRLTAPWWGDRGRQWAVAAATGRQHALDARR